MAGLVTSCNEQITLYEKVFIEYGMVHFKEDFSKKGAKMVRFWYYHSYYKRYQVEVATLELTQRGLAVARYCAKHLQNLTLKSLNQALDAVFSAKCVRDFSENHCPELRFALRQLTGMLYAVLLSIKIFHSESVRQEKDQREERAKQEEEDKYKVVRILF